VGLSCLQAEIYVNIKGTHPIPDMVFRVAEEQVLLHWALPFLEWIIRIHYHSLELRLTFCFWIIPLILGMGCEPS